MASLDKRSVHQYRRMLITINATQACKHNKVLEWAHAYKMMYLAACYPWKRQKSQR